MEYAIKKIQRKIRQVIASFIAKIILPFADNVDTVTQSTLDITDIFSQFEEAELNMGLKVNEDKTKYLVVPKQELHRTKHNFQVVKKF